MMPMGYLSISGQVTRDHRDHHNFSLSQEAAWDITVAALQPHSLPTCPQGGCIGLTSLVGLSGENEENEAEPCSVSFRKAKTRRLGSSAAPRDSGATEGGSGGWALSCLLFPRSAACSLHPMRPPGLNSLSAEPRLEGLSQTPVQADLLWPSQGHPARDTQPGPGEGFGLILGGGDDVCNGRDLR